MNGKALGLLICIGIILYMISSIGPYILIGLAVIALISIIVFLSINKSAKSVNKEKTVYDQADRTKSANSIKVARVPPSIIRTNSFVEDQKTIQSLVKAYNEVDNSLDTNNWIIRMLRYSSKFYSKKAFKDKNLFSFIIEEANNAILDAKQTSRRPKLIRECETIITSHH